ncbi:MAG: hypothetical protein L0287_23875, partial [Anaerolineae bacterium]|nr:hypothetical protein [Anaerolineae bacterium]
MPGIRPRSANLSLFASIINFFQLRNLVTTARRVLTVGLIVLLISNHALAAPQGIIAEAASFSQEVRFWWHNSGWAAKTEKGFTQNTPGDQKGWDGKGARPNTPPEHKEQEKQSDRDFKVQRIEI